MTSEQRNSFPHHKGAKVQTGNSCNFKRLIGIPAVNKAVTFDMAEDDCSPDDESYYSGSRTYEIIRKLDAVARPLRSQAMARYEELTDEPFDGVFRTARFWCFYRWSL